MSFESVTRVKSNMPTPYELTAFHHDTHDTKMFWFVLPDDPRWNSVWERPWNDGLSALDLSCATVSCHQTEDTRNHQKGRMLCQRVFGPKKIAASVRRLFGAAVYSRRVGISKYIIPRRVLPAKEQAVPPNVML